MFTKLLKNTTGGVALVLLGVIFGAGTVATLSANDGSTVHACVKANGGIRIVSDSSQCTGNEKSLDWSITGPAGAPGGVSGYEVVTRIEPMPLNSSNQRHAQCPSGKKVIGGGVSASVSSAVVFGSRPDFNNTAWLGEVFNHNHAGTMTVYAICANVQ